MAHPSPGRDLYLCSLWYTAMFCLLSLSSPTPDMCNFCTKNQLENFWLRNTRRWLKSQYLTNRQPDALHLLLHKYCYQVSLAKVLIRETKTHVCEAVCPHSDSRPACPNPGH